MATVYDIIARDPVLAAVAGELARYCDHRIAVSGSLQHVLSGEGEQFCEEYFGDTRKGRYSDIHRLVVLMLPKTAYGTAQKYEAWLVGTSAIRLLSFDDEPDNNERTG